mgnify:CR=1 FL=1
MVRKLLFLLFSMYYDDTTIQDWASTGADGQAHLGSLMELVGPPWSPSKSQPCSSSRDFLGLQHDCSEAHIGKLTFWPRQALVDKVLHIIEVSNEVRFPPGSAAKFYGVANFLKQAHLGVGADVARLIFSQGNMRKGLRFPAAYKEASHC